MKFQEFATLLLSTVLDDVIKLRRSETVANKIAGLELVTSCRASNGAPQYKLDIWYEFLIYQYQLILIDSGLGKTSVGQYWDIGYW